MVIFSYIMCIALKKSGKKPLYVIYQYIEKKSKWLCLLKKKKEILYPLTLIPLSLPPPSHEQALTTFCLYRFPDSGLPYEENHVMCGLL